MKRTHGLGVAVVLVRSSGGGRGQCIEYTVRSSVRQRRLCKRVLGWTGAASLAVIARMYWIETQVATELRAGANRR